MSSGKAHGINRAYQVTCRDVLTHRQPELTSWCDDGIDIPFRLPDTTWTFDVALTAPNGSVVVAECRRTIGPVKQEDIAGFALKVESLRRALARPVSAFFFTKSAHQLGAVRVGRFYGVEVAILAEDAHPPGFNMIFLAYDPARDKALRHFIMHCTPGEFKVTGTDACLTYTKRDGTSESR
ncbi:hypothetical protein [Nitrosovibrio sp. Nv6]|uniref:hypothetical protein n=1 Tax=Nitrosovibrio sp. Nv6 TaxID=1855340 RepID=UPI0008C0D4FA|nr:hypothetical protein [Nitrosovibrio sp. Nv6]SEP38442.1 hypothetical protein SAMN05216316_2709 [Nitrosovibrio sp. Nv6]